MDEIRQSVLLRGRGGRGRAAAALPAAGELAARRAAGLPAPRQQATVARVGPVAQRWQARPLEEEAVTRGLAAGLLALAGAAQPAGLAGRSEGLRRARGWQGLWLGPVCWLGLAREAVVVWGAHLHAEVGTAALYDVVDEENLPAQVRHQGLQAVVHVLVAEAVCRARGRLGRETFDRLAAARGGRAFGGFAGGEDPQEGALQVGHAAALGRVLRHENNRQLGRPRRARPRAQQTGGAGLCAAV